VSEEEIKEEGGIEGEEEEQFLKLALTKPCVTLCLKC